MKKSLIPLRRELIPDRRMGLREFIAESVRQVIKEELTSLLGPKKVAEIAEQREREARVEKMHRANVRWFKRYLKAQDELKVNPWLSADEAGQILGVCASTVRNYATLLGGKKDSYGWSFRKNDVLAGKDQLLKVVLIRKKRLDKNEGINDLHDPGKKQR